MAVRVATVGATQVRLGSLVESVKISRQDGDPVWLCDITMIGHNNPDLDSYFRTLYYDTVDYNDVTNRIFLGFVPGSSYVERVAGNKTTYHAVSHGWYLTHQYVQKERLSNLNTDTLEYRDPAWFIYWLLNGENGEWWKQTGIEYPTQGSTTGWDSSDLPAVQFAFRTNQRKSDAIREIEDYCVHLFDHRWASGEVIPTGYYQALGTVSEGSPYALIPADKTLIGEIQAEDLTNETFNHVTVGGYTSWFIVPFTNGTEMFEEGEVVTGETSNVSATILAGDDEQDGVVKTSGDYGNGDAAGYLIVLPDIKQTTIGEFGPEYIPGQFALGETITSDGGGSAITSAASARFNEQVEWYEKKYQLTTVTNGDMLPIEYREEHQGDYGYDSEVAIDNRALELYLYLVTKKRRYTAKFNNRSDLRLYQKLTISGFTKVPDGTYIINGIEYFEKGSEKTTTVNFLDYDMWKSKRRILKQSRNDMTSEIQKIVRQQLDSINKPETATVIDITDGGSAVVETTKGVQFRGQVR